MKLWQTNTRHQIAMDKKQIASLKAELLNAQPTFEPNGFQRTKIGTVEGTIIDIEEVDDVDGFKSYHKVYLVDNNGKTFTLRLAGKDEAKALKGDETTFNIAAGIKDQSKYYIMSAS